ncbi:hypothetical protein [Carnobacterium maltaromaticum]|uniref:hypothetical protein n=1 Tax=Carnobacterium maltaromaticum TaxID=2751 RepID=UPI00191BA65C|nr:hypothetical protein [Carnobacterium maltaromaticum]CAD5900216.1 conserved hypothetical protein [Carnobacterium maltaromaticum]
MTIDSNIFNDLFKIYEHINIKNGEKIDLSAFKTDNEVADGEKGIVYDFKEDVIDDIIEELQNLKNITNEFKKIDFSQNIDEMSLLYDFRLNLVKLISVYASLSSDFNELYDFHGEFIKSLPEGPEDDSELIK